MKKDVLAQDGLPPKKEVVVYAGMSSLQRTFYDLAGENALREALVRYVPLLPILLVCFVYSAHRTALAVLHYTLLGCAVILLVLFQPG